MKDKKNEQLRTINQKFTQTEKQNQEKFNSIKRELADLEQSLMTSIEMKKINRPQEK